MSSWTRKHAALGERFVYVRVFCGGVQNLMLNLGYLELVCSSFANDDSR